MLAPVIVVIDAYEVSGLFVVITLTVVLHAGGVFVVFDLFGVDLWFWGNGVFVCVCVLCWSCSASACFCWVFGYCAWIAWMGCVIHCLDTGVWGSRFYVVGVC